MELSFYLENFYGFHIERLNMSLIKVRKPALARLSMKHVIEDPFLDFSWVHKQAIWIFYQPMRDRDLEWRRQALYKGMTIFVIDSYSL